jgi:hypothetical protein
MTQPVPASLQFVPTTLAQTQVIPDDTLTAGVSFPTQDWVTIEGQVSPGKVTIQNVKLPKDWQKNKGFGLTGATLVPMGEDLGTFTLFFEFWMPSQVAAWRLYWKQFFQKQLVVVKGSAVAMALNIGHPMLDFVALGPCVVTDSGGLDKDEMGTWFHSVHLEQYRKAKPALQKAIAVIPAAAKAVPVAQDAQDIAIQQLQAKIAANSDPQATAISTPSGNPPP